MDTQSLKPCPFCGAEFCIAQEPHDNHPVAGLWYIYHDYGPIGSAARKCLIDVRQHFGSADDALAAWNTRTSDDTLASQAAEIARLREALRQIADLDEVEAALDPEWTINRARAALNREKP